jgi:hypothetical protein
MYQRGWDTLSAKEEGRSNSSQKCKLTSRLEKAGVVTHAQQPGVGKLVRVAEGGKLHRRVGKTHFPCEL